MHIESAQYLSQQPAGCLVVSISEDGLQLAHFYEAPNHPVVTLEYGVILEYAKAFDVFTMNFPPEGLRTPSGVMVFGGMSSFSFSDIMGDDEVTDYSIVDFYIHNNCLIPWVSRLASTKPEKILYSARFRDVNQYSLAASLYVPFNNGSLDDCVLHLVDRGHVKCSAPIDNAFDGSVLPVGPNGGARWREHFYSADLAIVSQDAASTLIEARLKWNRDGSPCAKSPLFYLEASAGYLPKRRVQFENGVARFSVSHLGLQPGDEIKVKVNAKHFTNLGQLECLVP